jgi:hypothetical protein
MNALISGGTGLVGTELTKQLLAAGHHVTILSRSASLPAALSGAKAPDVSVWDPAKGEIDLDVVAQSHVIFNLAGASVSERWTSSHKEAIYQSRYDSTSTLVKAISAMDDKILVSASAIGIYPSKDDWSTESTLPDEGFLSEVVQMWEDEALRATQDGHRVVCLRIGLVLSERGGALDRLLPIFKTGFGSPVGSGKHWQSWIHIEDLAKMFIYAAENDLNGVYNAVAPEPVTNKVFSKSIAKALGKPFFMPNVPAFMLKLLFGEMSQIVLASNRVKSEKIEKAGFSFRFKAIDAAMNDLLD